MGTKRLSLKDWINEVGIEFVAKELGCAESAVGHWRNGHCLPRTKQMARIKKLSGGRVTYDEMIETHIQLSASK